MRGEVRRAGEMEPHGDLLVVRWGLAVDGSVGAVGLWEELGEREVEAGTRKRTGYLSWSFFGFEKGRLKDEKSLVGIGREEESSWWGSEDIWNVNRVKGGIGSAT